MNELDYAFFSSKIKAALDIENCEATALALVLFLCETYDEDVSREKTYEKIHRNLRMYRMNTKLRKKIYHEFYSVHAKTPHQLAMENELDCLKMSLALIYDYVEEWDRLMIFDSLNNYLKSHSIKNVNGTTARRTGENNSALQTGTREPYVEDESLQQSSRSH